jgi:hypothetical protein
MKDFNVKRWDCRFPMDIVIRQGAPEFSYGGNTMCYPPVEFEMTFYAPHELDTVENVALMYFQFDQFMKERYGEYINQYREREQAKKIDTP